jgi:hypothetical protein
MLGQIVDSPTIWPGGRRWTMIVSNRNYPFGSRIAVLSTPCFNCRISTAKEGVFKGQSTMVLDLAGGDSPTIGRAVAKLVYSDALRSADRLQMHDAICESIDAAGRRVSLGQAIQEVATAFKMRGILTDVINIAAEIAEEPIEVDFQIGQYSLDTLGTHVVGRPELLEWSEERYAKERRPIENESAFDAPPAAFMGHTWGIVIAAVCRPEGGYRLIYKIDAFLGLPTRAEADEVLRPVLAYCTQQLGAPLEEKTDECTWVMGDKEVYFQTDEGEAGCGIWLSLIWKRGASWLQFDLLS